MWKDPEDKDLPRLQKIFWFLIGACVGVFACYGIIEVRVQARVADTVACAKTCGCFEYDLRDDGCWCLAEPKRE